MDNNAQPSSLLKIYHEKQVNQLCALHALNNLFQNKESFTKFELDKICEELSPDEWINPHRSMLGLGNYDINVIMKVLQKRKYDVIWYDKRRDPELLNLKEIFGFILNVITNFQISFIQLPIKRRHWIAIRKINNNNNDNDDENKSENHIYYNLDSKLKNPECIGNNENLINYLKCQIGNEDTELFLIVHDIDIV